MFFLFWFKNRLSDLTSFRRSSFTSIVLSSCMPLVISTVIVQQLSESMTWDPKGLTVKACVLFHNYFLDTSWALMLAVLIVQNRIGADIIMALDDVVKTTITGPRIEEAMYRTLRWIDRCIAGKSIWEPLMFSCKE